MCKLAIISGITSETKDKAWEFIKQMSIEMSAPNCPEDDGFGYAAIDNEGKLFGERWLKNKDAFVHRNPYGNDIDTEIVKKFKILSKEKVYNNFGILSNDIRSITLHSRMATSGKGMRNTHPFIKKSTSLIHNGVIHNHDKLHKEMSSCDSEVILHEYLRNNIANKPEKFQKVANKLEGYYALGIFSKTDNGEIILDIIKDNNAKLNAYFIKELNTIVYATPKYTTSPVEETCKKLGFTIISIYEVKENKLMRINALTGEPIVYVSFKPKERIYNYSPSYNDYKSSRHGTVNEYETWNSLFGHSKSQGKSNVIDMTTHTTKSKTALEQVKERLLEESLHGKELSKEDIEKLTGENDKSEIVEKFNDAGHDGWIRDDKFTWYKNLIS